MTGTQRMQWRQIKGTGAYAGAGGDSSRSLVRTPELLGFETQGRPGLIARLLRAPKERGITGCEWSPEVWVDGISLRLRPG